MRVIHLVIGGDTGGAKTHIITLLTQLKEFIDIELICLTEGALYAEALDADIHASLIKQKSRFDLSVVKKVAKKVNTTHADLLHCHGARANFVAAFVKKHIAIPVITTVHSDYTLDFAHNWYKKLVFTQLNRYGLSKMDYYLSVTNVFKELLVEQGFDESKIRTVYNGVSVMDEDGVNRLSRENNKEIVFGCVTRLVPIKGTHILLEAVRICVEKGYKPRVKIAGTGEGDYVESLYQFIQDNHLEDYAEFVGYIREMDHFYQTIDVNILPSLTETFPYALLEGGMRKKASVASKAGGIVEMIEDGVSGRLFETEDAKELAKIMIDFIKHPEQASRFGEAFRNRIIDRFSDKAMAKRHIEIYDELSS